MSRGITGTLFTGLWVDRLVMTSILRLDESLIELLRMNGLRRNDVKSEN